MSDFQRMLTESFVAEVKKRGVRGLARESGVSPTYISRIKSGHEAMPVEGKLAGFLKAVLTDTAMPPAMSVEAELRYLRAEVDKLRERMIDMERRLPKEAPEC